MAAPLRSMNLELMQETCLRLKLSLSNDFVEEQSDRDGLHERIGSFAPLNGGRSTRSSMITVRHKHKHASSDKLITLQAKTQNQEIGLSL